MPKTKILNSAGITAAIGLAALPVFLTLAPMFNTSDASAEAAVESIGAAAKLSPNLSLSADSVSIEMNPTGTGAIFKSGSINAHVSTNNETGYTLYFSDKDDDTSLRHKNLADTAIASIGSSADSNGMTDNTWGYAVVANPTGAEDEDLSLTYSPIPTEYTPIKTTGSQTSSDNTKLTFGVKVNNDLPSGIYSDEILISAVINYSAAGYDQSQLWLDKNGVQITTMQQMTPAVCASVPTPTVSATGANIPTITLQDTRNNEIYTVKKLADGNCWMTSDLKLSNLAIEPTKSNVTQGDLNSAAINEASDFTTVNGKTVFNLPEAVASTSTTDTNAEAQVANDGYGDPSGTSEERINLYNWYAATAGTGKSDMESESLSNPTNAPGDICPKGWQLPNVSGDMSWDKLLRVGQGVYEIATDNDKYSADKVAWGSYIGIKDATANPLGLHVVGGFWESRLQWVDYGGYWTRAAHTDARSAYYMYYGSSSIYPQSNTNSGDRKGVGRGVRCVAKGKEYMQDWAGCPNLAEHDTATLYDKRDEKEYTVSKLKDGNCWMTSDLKIEDAVIEPTKSNVTTSVTLPAAKGYSSTNATNTAAEIANDGVNGAYLYNWFAAIAATPGTNLETDTAYGAGKTAPQDICPRGWHLPDDAGDTSWNRLLRVGQDGYQIATGGNKYSSSVTSWGTGTKFTVADQNPLGMHPTGIFSDGLLTNADGGYYWSRTAQSNTYAFFLTFSGSDIYPQGYLGKHYGRAVRCVYGS